MLAVSSVPCPYWIFEEKALVLPKIVDKQMCYLLKKKKARLEAQGVLN
jgi:hypothetical protein